MEDLLLYLFTQLFYFPIFCKVQKYSYLISDATFINEFINMKKE